MTVPVFNGSRMHHYQQHSNANKAYHGGGGCGPVKAKLRQTRSAFVGVSSVADMFDQAHDCNANAGFYNCYTDMMVGNSGNNANDVYVNRQIPQWSVAEVTRWVSGLGFPAGIVDNFRTVEVDGDLLLQLEEKNLRDDLQMSNGIQRKRFIRELNNLKKEADYSANDAEDIEGFLVSQVGAEYKVYTYNFISNDLSLSLMRRLGSGDLEDMLKEAGIASSIHRRKIVEAVVCDTDSNLDDSINNASGSYPGSLVESSTSVTAEVYVSFDKKCSAELASLIRMQLQLRGFTVHTADSASSQRGALACIRECKNFVIVLTKNALDGCVGDAAKKDQLHREVAAALDADCNIIPVFDDFQFPESESLPEDMRTLCYFNGVRWVHDYQDACIDKIERFVTGEGGSTSTGSASRNGSLGRLAAANRLRGSSGADSGRSTPQTSRRNLRSRTVSSESGIFFQAQ